MKVLIDTNVVLDILLNRIDFYEDSVSVFVMAEKKLVTGYISASAITDIFFIAKKKLGKKHTKEAIKEILQVFKPATVSDTHIYQALDIDWDDFEDSIQYIVGKSFFADYIITRNSQDYSSSLIPALTPRQFINIITNIVD